MRERSQIHGPNESPEGKKGPRGPPHAQGSGHTSAVSRAWLKPSFLVGHVRLGDSFREAAGACGSGGCSPGSMQGEADREPASQCAQGSEDPGPAPEPERPPLRRPRLPAGASLSCSGAALPSQASPQASGSLTSPRWPCRDTESRRTGRRGGLPGTQRSRARPCGVVVADTHTHTDAHSHRGTHTRTCTHARRLTLTHACTSHACSDTQVPTSHTHTLTCAAHIHTGTLRALGTPPPPQGGPPEGDTHR